MFHDGEACKKADTMCVVWTRRLDQHITQHVDEVAEQSGLRAPSDIKATTSFFAQGAFNRCYKVKINERLSIIFRFPILGKVAFPREKVIDEALIIKYIAKNTSIPTPKLIRVSDSSWGPYTVTEFVEGTLMSELLKAPREPGRLEILNPNINSRTLIKAYQGMGRILIELSKCQFSHIGGVCRDKSGQWCIGKRPLTLDTNQLVALANYPPNDLPANIFSTATDYFVVLARNHMTHLRTQRNDAVIDDADCRKKYVARCLFLKVAQNFSKVYNNGPFRLFCDDLRPSNVIVDSQLEVQCVIDWEFCYAAPAELTYCSPWWLLLAHPDDWEGDLDSFLTQYIPRHEIFLTVLQELEDREIQRDALSASERLSDRMALSVKNVDFWFCLAANSSFLFDDVYWRFIDSAYFGKFTSLEDRIGLLSAEERGSLETFVRSKMQQANERTLDEHRTLDEILAA